jgi:hypothetical protein
MSNMTEKEIAEAQRRARDWTPADPLDKQAWDRNEARNGTKEKTIVQREAIFHRNAPQLRSHLSHRKFQTRDRTCVASMWP